MKLIKNYLYNIGYQIFALIIPLITVPYISRILGSEGIGINAFTNSIISYFVLFGSIGINLYGNRTIAYVRDDKKQLSQNFWEIAFLRIIIISFSYIIFLVILSFIKKYQELYFYQSFLIVAAGLDISWFFMGIEDFKKTVLRNILVKLVSLAAIFMLVKNKNDLGIYILISGMSTLLGNLTLWSYLKRVIFKPNWKNLSIFKHLLPALTLFVPQIATQIYLILNKTMLGIMTDVQNVGYYENSDKLIKMVLAISTASGAVMLPRVANTFSTGNKDKVKSYVNKSFDFVSAISIPLSLGLSAIAPKFSTWFFGDEFITTGKLIPILSLVIIFIGWTTVMGTQYLLPTNQIKYFTFSVTVGACVNLLLNIPLIYFYGVFGAVLATVLSEISVTLIQVYFVGKTIERRLLFKEIWKYIAAGIIMFTFVRLANNYMSQSILAFTIQVCIGIITYSVVTIILKAKIIDQIREILSKKKYN